VIILLRIHDARVDPEQPLVLDALKQLPEVPSGPRAGAVGPQIGAQDLHHRVAALVVGGGARLGVGVSGAALLVPLEALPAVGVVVSAGPGEGVAAGQVLLPP